MRIIIGQDTQDVFHEIKRNAYLASRKDEDSCWQIIVAQIAKKFLEFYGFRKFVTVFMGHESSPHHDTLFSSKIQFNNTLQATPTFPKQTYSFRLFNLRGSSKLILNG
jgi:hypothetical protein